MAVVSMENVMNAGKVIDIRGRRLGGETPLICSPLVGRTRDGVLAEAAIVVAARPDVIEWRVDFFEAVGDTAATLDTGKALRAVAGDTPIIFTRRSAREGGEPAAIDDEGVVRLYDAVGAGRVADLLDFEMGNDPAHVRRVRDDAHRHGIRVILSYHNFRETPPQEFLAGRFREAERQGGDVAKVAVMPRTRTDVLELLAATAQADAECAIPLISMSMGPLGSVTRMVGGVFGSALTFAVGADSSAPGQMPIADLRVMFDIVRRAGGGR